MGAPTWPPTPEEADRATLAEYGDQARAVISDDEAEQAILARFLFAPPPRQDSAGQLVGTSLSQVQRSLEGWLAMVSGRPVTVGASDPPSTDGQDIFLPRAAPSPVQPAEDALLYRVMALVQEGFIRFGLLDNRPLLVEIHRDWVLRSCFHLLALRVIRERWIQLWPGMAADFRGVAALDKATSLRVGLVDVPRRGMPQAFLPLYEGLVDLLGEAGAEGELARSAVSAVEAIDDPRATMVILLGAARRLRQGLHAMRLGPPPLPRYAGLLRPEWLLHDVAAETRAQDAWKEGPRPLRLLRDVMRRRGAERSGLPPSVDHTLAALKTTQDQPPPADEEGWLYEEWDDAKGVLRVDATRVVELEATGGALESYERIVRANQDRIAAVRRRFAALRLEERWLHGQPDGSDLDLGRLLVAMGDLRAGQTPRTDFYKRFQRQRQDIAVLTLVDISGSTQGEIVRLQQHALVLLTEGLRALRTPHAAYAFQNFGPRDCRYQRLKGWDEDYYEPVFKRLANLSPGGSTRLGAFLRHAGYVLGRRPETRRLLLILSDGRPHDREDYTGAQALADSSLAAQGLRRNGVHVHCLSMDTQDSAEHYLRTIFGPGRFSLLSRPDQLPDRLPEVLRELIK